MPGSKVHIEIDTKLKSLPSSSFTSPAAQKKYEAALKKATEQEQRLAKLRERLAKAIEEAEKATTAIAKKEAIKAKERTLKDIKAAEAELTSALKLAANQLNQGAAEFKKKISEAAKQYSAVVSEFAKATPTDELIKLGADVAKLRDQIAQLSRNLSIRKAGLQMKGPLPPRVYVPRKGPLSPEATEVQIDRAKKQLDAAVEAFSKALAAMGDRIDDALKRQAEQVAKNAKAAEKIMERALRDVSDTDVARLSKVLQAGHKSGAIADRKKRRRIDIVDAYTASADFVKKELRSRKEQERKAKEVDSAVKSALDTRKAAAELSKLAAEREEQIARDEAKRAEKRAAAAKKKAKKADTFVEDEAVQKAIAQAEKEHVEAKKKQAEAAKLAAKQAEKDAKRRAAAIKKYTGMLPDVDLSRVPKIPAHVAPEAAWTNTLPAEYTSILRDKRLKYTRIKSASKRYSDKAKALTKTAESATNPETKASLLAEAKALKDRAEANKQLAETIRQEREGLKIAMVARIREYQGTIAAAKATTRAEQDVTKQTQRVAQAKAQQAAATKRAAKAAEKEAASSEKQPQKDLPKSRQLIDRVTSVYDAEVKRSISEAQRLMKEAASASSRGDLSAEETLQAKAEEEARVADALLKARKEFKDKAVKIWSDSLKALGRSAKADKLTSQAIVELFASTTKKAGGASLSDVVAAGGKGTGAGYSEQDIRAAIAALRQSGVIRAAGGGAGAGAGAGGGGGATGSAGGIGGGTGGGASGGGRRGDINTLWEQLSKFFDKLSNLDISTLFQLPAYRALAGRHGTEYRADYPKGLPKEADIEKYFGGFSTATPGRMSALIKSLKSLTDLATTGGPGSSKALAPILSQVSELTSSRGGVDITGDSKERRRFMLGAQRIVFAALKKLTSSVSETTYEIEDSILDAAKKVEQARKSGDAKKIEQTTAHLVERVRDLIHTVYSLDDLYSVIERTGGTAFDINLERTGKKGAFLRKPTKVIPEASFRDRAYERVNLEASIRREEAKTGVNLGAAREAIKIAQSFEEIADDAERVRQAFGILFTKLEPGSVAFKKNMEIVIEGLKTLSQKDILDRKEVDNLIKVFEKYANVTQNYNLLNKGLPQGGGVIRIPIEFSSAKGGTEGEFLRQIEAAKRRLAKAAGVSKGERIPIIFEVPDASGGMRKMMVEFRKMGDTVDAVSHKVKDLAKIMNTRELFATALRRVAMWGTAAGLTYGAISVFRDAINTMVEAESGVVSLSKVMSEADLDFKKFTQDVIAFSTTAVTKYAAGLKEIYDVMGVFGRQGKSLIETQKLTEAVLLTTNISILNQNDAAEALTATLKQFGMEASNVTHIIDAWNEVANNNAVSVKTLADATKKAGAAAHTVGVDFEQFLGIVTAIGESTRQPGKEIGTSLRFIFQRSLRPETTRELARAGVQTKDLSGNFKGFGSILTDLADKWDTLSKAQRLAIAQAMGGARQYNAFLNLMNNYDTAVKATTEAINSQGSAQKENAKYMESARAKMLQARAAVQQMYVNLGSSLLPVIKSVSEATTAMAKAFSAIPNSVKLASVALLGMGTVISRIATNLDYVIGYGATGAGAGVGGLAAAIGGGLIGRAKTPEQIGSLAKRASLTSAARAGKATSDLGGGLYGLLGGKDAVEALGEQGLALKKIRVDRIAQAGGGFKLIKKYVDADIDSVSKLDAVVRGFGVQAEGATEAARLGISSLNSPLLMLVAVYSKIGKGLVNLGISTAAWAAKTLTFFSTGARAAIDYGSAVAKAKVSQLGLLRSIALSTAAVAGIYYLVKAMSEYGDTTKKTREELEKELQAELTKRKDALNLVSKEAAALEHLAAKRRKVQAVASRYGSPEERVDAIRQGKYKSAIIEQIKYERLRAKAGAVVAKASPTSVRSIDKFGRVVLDVSKSMIELSKGAVRAKAAMVALTQTKLAAKSAEEANDSFKKLNKAIKEYKKVLPFVKVKRGFLGSYTDMSTGFTRVTNDLIKASDAFNAKLKEVETTILSFPKSTPLSSFLSLLARKELVEAFRKDLEFVNEVLRKNGKEAATVGDKVNELFLRVKGFRGVGTTGEVTSESLLQKGVLSRSIDEFAREAKRGGASLARQHLITFGPEGPFGLTQARVVLDKNGEYLVEGINKFERKVRVSLAEVRRNIKDESQALIFDPSQLVQEFNNSILKVKKSLAGAGAGLIKFSSQLDLGVKFGFELSGIDRLQRVGPAVQNMITAAVQAQSEYDSATTRFVADTKEAANASEKIATSLQNYYNSIARVASQKILFVSLANEIANLGSAVERAVYDFRKARLADEISQQFATIYTSAAGFTSNLSFTLPKLGSELSPAEQISATNPELAKAIRAATEAVALVENNIKASRTITSIDLPKMLSEAGAANAKRFFDQADQDRKITAEAMKKYGGDRRFAQLAHSQDQTTKAVSDMHKGVVHELKKLSDPGYMSKQAEALSSSVSKVGSYAYTKFVSALNANQKEERKATARARTTKPPVVELGAEAKDYLAKLYKKGTEKGLSGDELAKYIRSGFISEFHKQTIELLKRLPDRPTQERTSPTGLAGLISEYVWTNGGKFLYDKVQKPVMRFFSRDYGKEYSSGEKAAFKIFDEISSQYNKVTSASIDVFKKYIEAMRKGAPEAIKYGGGGTKDIDVIRKYNQVISTIVTSMDQSFNALSLSIGKEIKKRQELISGIGVAATAARSFSNSIQKALYSVISSARQEAAIGGLRAPIVGAAAGVPSFGNISIGKSYGELTALERVYKKFPEFVGPIVKQERIRLSLLQQLPTIYSQLSAGMRRIKELSAGAPAEQRGRYERIYQTSADLFSALSSEVRRANDNMAPLLESLRRMAELEKASKSIESIVQSLLMAQDLSFDTTSIDKALGRHPLSPTANVYGQPADLNKFERQMFELERKRRSGEISSGDFYKQRDVIEYNKKEALRQYEQSRENSKLQREVEGAKRAMEVLWKAQLSGVGGVQPIIETLKSQLERAGESYDVGGTKYYRGVPGLFDVQQKLAEIQKQAKTMDFRQQRAVVMAGVEDLLDRVNKQIESQANLIDSIQKEVAGGNIINKLTDLLNAFTAGHKALRETFVSSMAGLQKSFTSTLGSKKDSSARILEATTSTLGKVTDSFDKSVSTFAPAVEEFRKAVHALVTATGNISTRSSGTKQLPTRDKGVGEGYFTGGYVQQYGKGGAVRGPAGIDNIQALLPEGGFVLSRNAVSSVGMPALDKLSAASTGKGNLVPGRVSSGEYIFSKEQVDRLGVGFLKKLNQGKSSSTGRYGLGGVVKKVFGVFGDDSLFGSLLPEEAAKKYEQYMSKAAEGADVFGAKKPEDLRFARQFYKKLDEAPVRTIRTTADTEAAQRVIRGEGQGYIRVGNRVLALANPNLVSTSYRKQSQVRMLRQAARSGTFTKQQLRQLAYGIVGKDASIGLYTDFAPELKPSDREFVRALGMGMSPRRLAKMRKAMQSYNKYSAFSQTPEAKEIFGKKRATAEASDEAVRALYNQVTEAASTPAARKKLLDELRKRGDKEGFYRFQSTGIGGLKASRAKLATLGGLVFGLAGQPKPKDKKAASVYNAFAETALTPGELTLPRVNVNGTDYALTTMVDPRDGRTYVVDTRSKGKGWADHSTGKYVPGIHIPLEKFTKVDLGKSTANLRGIILRSLKQSGGFGATPGLLAFDKSKGILGADAYAGEAYAEQLLAQKRAKESDNFLLRFARGPKTTTNAVEAVRRRAHGLYSPGMLIARFAAGTVGGTYSFLRHSIPNYFRDIRRQGFGTATGNRASALMDSFLANLNLMPGEREADIKAKPDSSGVLYNLLGRWIGYFRGRGLGNAPDIGRLQQNLANVAFSAAVPFVGPELKAAARATPGALVRSAKYTGKGLRRAGRFALDKFRDFRVARKAKGAVDPASLRAGVPSVGEAIAQGGGKNLFHRRLPSDVANDLIRLGINDETLAAAARSGGGITKVFDFIRNAINRRNVRRAFEKEGQGVFGGIPLDAAKKLSLDELLAYMRGGTEIRGTFGLGRTNIAQLRVSRMGGAFGKGRLRRLIDFLRVQWFRRGVKRRLSDLYMSRFFAKRPRALTGNVVGGPPFALTAGNTAGVGGIPLAGTVESITGRAGSPFIGNTIGTRFGAGLPVIDLVPSGFDAAGLKVFGRHPSPLPGRVGTGRLSLPAPSSRFGSRGIPLYGQQPSITMGGAGAFGINPRGAELRYLRAYNRALADRHMAHSLAMGIEAKPYASLDISTPGGLTPYARMNPRKMVSYILRESNIPIRLINAEEAVAYANALVGQGLSRSKVLTQLAKAIKSDVFNRYRVKQRVTKRSPSFAMTASGRAYHTKVLLSDVGRYSGPVPPKHEASMGRFSAQISRARKAAAPKKAFSAEEVQKIYNEIFDEVVDKEVAGSALIYHLGLDYDAGVKVGTPLKQWPGYQRYLKDREFILAQKPRYRQWTDEAISQALADGRRFGSRRSIWDFIDETIKERVQKRAEAAKAAKPTSTSSDKATVVGKKPVRASSQKATVVGKKPKPFERIDEEPPKFATGGLVRGAGTGVSDSILALLSNGEYVVPSDVVNKMGVGFFESLREGVPGFRNGGFVETVTSPTLLRNPLDAINSKIRVSLEKIAEVLSSAASTLTVKGGVGAGLGVSPVPEPIIFSRGITQRYGPQLDALLARRASPVVQQLSAQQAEFRKTAPFSAGGAIGEPSVVSYTRRASQEALMTAAQEKEWRRTAPKSAGGLMGEPGMVDYTRRASQEAIMLAAQKRERGRTPTKKELQYYKEEDYAHAMAAMETEWEKTRPPFSKQDEYLLTTDRVSKYVADRQRGLDMQEPDLPWAGRSIGEVGATSLAKQVDSSGIASVVDKISSAISGVNTTLSDLSNNIADSVSQSLEKATITLSSDTITSMQEAVKTGTSEGLSDLSDSITSAISSMGDVTGTGAAIRPGIIESLEGSMDVVRERIDDAVSRVSSIEEEMSKTTSSFNDAIEQVKQYTDDKVSSAVGTEKTERITELNKRLSSVSADIESSVISKLNPTIQNNSNSISENNHLIAGLQALVHSVLARLGNTNA